MFLGRSNFPNATDISAEYVSKVADSQLGDLMEHLQMQFEKVLAPQTLREKAHSEHINALVVMVRSRINASTRSKYHEDLADLRSKRDSNEISLREYALKAKDLLHQYTTSI